ncbi:hypothetical protein KFE25_007825 [Diacronema lutheri]|uniref:Uncharacterized protein n=1 Tax=Diacronema lutheri TaxID=2081491 RepID=A0A8J5XVM9_DIALT|nr:hypothetical protein KFE25_007825 [Diacronema lutheri]
MSAFSDDVSWEWSATWGSADWNWGYARGTAHDRAALLRSAVRSAEARSTWQAARAPVGELILGLALAVQRAENMGRPSPLSDAMAALAAGQYSDEGSACEALLAQMEVHDPSNARLAAIAAMPASEERRRTIVLAALDCVQFAERGM